MLSQRAANVNRHSYNLRAADRHALPPNGKIFEKWRDSQVYVSSAPGRGCNMEAARSGQTRPTTIGFRGTMRVFARGILSPALLWDGEGGRMRRRAPVGRIADNQ